jgi:hypothetical protein
MCWKKRINRELFDSKGAEGFSLDANENMALTSIRDVNGTRRIDGSHFDAIEWFPQTTTMTLRGMNTAI